ncbi:GCN5-related N-acetyltransferase [Microcoleus vaginatus FGP-2]|nr:GCN5-related N-acetyltransferase [Microcoleus vaginatus FGP-2]
MFELVRLDETNAFQYDRLTYPTFRPRLRILKHDRSLIAVGVHLHQMPVGLALAEYLPDEGAGEILSLFVAPEYRGQGLGKALLREMESHLRQHDCLKLHLVYTPNSTTPVLENILLQHHWNPPQPRMLICTGTPEAIQKAAWLKLDTIADPHYTMFPWVELTAQERQDILLRQAQSRWYPDILSPFKEEAILEPLNSLGLRYRDRVVGWMITHRITSDTIRYTSLFVKEELQTIGRAIPLLATAIKIHVQHRESHQAIFTVAIDNAPMVKFVQRRLAPYLVSMRQSMQSFKLMDSDATVQQ